MEPKAPQKPFTETQEELNRIGLMVASIYKGLVRNGVPAAHAGPMATDIAFKLVGFSAQRQAQAQPATPPTASEIINILFGGRGA